MTDSPAGGTCKGGHPLSGPGGLLMHGGGPLPPDADAGGLLPLVPDGGSVPSVGSPLPSAGGPPLLSLIYGCD